MVMVMKTWLLMLLMKEATTGGNAIFNTIALRSRGHWLRQSKEDAKSMMHGSMDGLNCGEIKVHRDELVDLIDNNFDPSIKVECFALFKPHNNPLNLPLHLDETLRKAKARVGGAKLLPKISK